MSRYSYWGGKPQPTVWNGSRRRRRRLRGCARRARISRQCSLRVAPSRRRSGGRRGATTSSRTATSPIVWNAGVAELQKLGLELPPQINCFVQSMARLSNTQSEMTTIMDNFDALSATFEDSRTRLMADVFSITSNELKTGWFAGETTRVQAVKDDALKMAGDNSYQIDIGV